MDEGDASAAGPAPRHLVDETKARRPAALQRPVQIRHAVADMMDARPAPGEKLRHRAGEYEGKLKVTKVDVDANQKTAMRFNVRSIPSILFFKDGRHVDTLVGAYPKPVFVQKIQQHLS